MTNIDEEFGTEEEELFATLKHGLIYNQAYHTVLHKNKVPKKYIRFLEAAEAFQLVPKRIADSTIAKFLQCSIYTVKKLREEFINWQRENSKFYDISEDIDGVFIYAPNQEFLSKIKNQQAIYQKHIEEIERQAA